LTVTDDRPRGRELHPIHGVLVAGTIPLFLGGLLSDLAYSSSYQIEWSHFASWLIVGGLFYGGLALLWAVVDLLRTNHRGEHSRLYTLLLLATWVLGFLNSLVHARDAWAVMPTGLILSVIVVLLACASTWIGFVKFGVGGDK